MRVSLNEMFNSTMIFYVLLLLLLPLSILLLLANIYVYSSYSSQAWEPISPFRWMLATLLPIIMCHWGVSRKHLSTSGAIAAFIVGFVMTMASYSFTSAMLTFFITGSRVTKWRKNIKRKLEATDTDQRNWVQVVCNGGVAAQLALIYIIDSGSGERFVDLHHRYSSSWVTLAVLGALTCCAGDTFASEVGSAVGSGRALLITSFKRVPRGTNGGISFVGSVASLFGGLTVGLAFYLTQYFCATDDLIPQGPTPAQWPIIILGALSGLLGSMVDSWLGATFQYSGIDDKTGHIVEKPGPGVTHICGRYVLSNHGVNLVSSLIMCIVTPQLAGPLLRRLTQL